MKKIFSLIILSLMLISLISVVSACGPECPIGKTMIAGKIYEEATGDVVKNADVEIVCNGILKTTKSGYYGKYIVIFSQDECEYGDSVTVTAQKGTLIGTVTGVINQHIDGKFCLDLDIGIFNVPLVPEFGVIVGVLTIFSAVGVFFFVRRE